MTNRQSRRDQNRQARRQKSRPQRSSSSSDGGGFRFDFKKYGFWIGVTVLAVVLLVIVLVMANTRDEGPTLDKEGVLYVEELHDALIHSPSELVNGMEIGSPDSPLTLEVYADFQCPHCLRHAAIIEPALIENYVKNKKLKIVFRHFPVLGRESVLAASAATCAAEQDSFWIYANRLFKERARAGTIPPNRGIFSEEGLIDIATELDLDVDQFKRCQASPETLSVVSRHESQARQYGLTGTPSFVLSIGEKQIIVSPSTLEEWEVFLDEQLKIID